MKVYILTALLACLASCTKQCSFFDEELTPEQVVQSYLDISINMKDPKEKEKLLGLTTGVLHSSLNSATDDTLAKAFIEKRYKLESYSVIERRDRTPRDTEVTFALVYFDQSTGKPEDAPKTTTENTVALTKEEGVWKIRDVLGKKTSIEFFVENEVIKPIGQGAPEDIEPLDESSSPEGVDGSGGASDNP